MCHLPTRTSFAPSCLARRCASALPMPPVAPYTIYTAFQGMDGGQLKEQQNQPNFGQVVPVSEGPCQPQTLSKSLEERLALVLDTYSNANTSTTLSDDGWSSKHGFSSGSTQLNCSAKPMDTNTSHTWRARRSGSTAHAHGLCLTL